MSLSRLACQQRSGTAYLSNALSTTNFDFIAAVVCQYPHILNKIYLPEDYVAIVLSGIVTGEGMKHVTTELTVGFDIHLPYPTKDGSATSFLVAAGHDIAVQHWLTLHQSNWHDSQLC